MAGLILEQLGAIAPIKNRFFPKRLKAVKTGVKRMPVLPARAVKRQALKPIDIKPLPALPIGPVKRPILPKRPIVSRCNICSTIKRPVLNRLPAGPRLLIKQPGALTLTAKPLMPAPAAPLPRVDKTTAVAPVRPTAAAQTLPADQAAATTENKGMELKEDAGRELTTSNTTKKAAVSFASSLLPLVVGLVIKKMTE